MRIHYCFKVSFVFLILIAFAFPIKAQELYRGYKGFVTVGYGAGSASVSNYKSSLRNQFIEIETIHGFQFNPHIFLGGGVGSQSFLENDVMGEDGFTTSNIMAAVKYSMINGRITPFLEGKVGVTMPFNGELTDYVKTGLYASPSIGCRFGLSRRLGLDLAAGYNFHQFPGKGGGAKVNLHSVVVRLGIDF